jgi:hypothetical protein
MVSRLQITLTYPTFRHRFPQQRLTREEALKGVL